MYNFILHVWRDRLWCSLDILISQTGQLAVQVNGIVKPVIHSVIHSVNPVEVIRPVTVQCSVTLLNLLSRILQDVVHFKF